MIAIRMHICLYKWTGIINKLLQSVYFHFTFIPFLHASPLPCIKSRYSGIQGMYSADHCIIVHGSPGHFIFAIISLVMFGFHVYESRLAIRTKRTFSTYIPRIERERPVIRNWFICVGLYIKWRIQAPPPPPWTWNIVWKIRTAWLGYYGHIYVITNHHEDIIRSPHNKIKPFFDWY